MSRARSDRVSRRRSWRNSAAAGAEPPQLAREVVDRSAAPAGEAASSHAPARVDVQARSSILVERAADLVVASRRRAEQCGDVHPRRDAKERIVAEVSIRLLGPTTVERRNIDLGRICCDLVGRLNVRPTSRRSSVTGRAGWCLWFQVPGGRRILPASKHARSAWRACARRRFAASASRGDNGSRKRPIGVEVAPRSRGHDDRRPGSIGVRRAAATAPSHSAHSTQTSPIASFVPARRVRGAHPT